MVSVLTFLFVLVCIMLLAIILLQSSKGGGMGSAISGQSMNDAFGGEGADKLLVKLTGFLAFAFMVLAISIGKINNKESVLSNYQSQSPSNEDSGGNTSGTTDGGADKSTTEGN